MKKKPRRIQLQQPIIAESFPQSILKGIAPAELFIGIWPQQVSLDRVDITIVYQKHDKQTQNTAQEFKIRFDDDIDSPKVILIDKKADFLDTTAGYFLDITRGVFITADAKRREQNDYFFAGDYYKQKKFREMLDKLESKNGKQEDLAHYMHRNFNDIIARRQSFTFAIYLKVKFWLQDGCYFFSRKELPHRRLPIYSMLVMAKSSPTSSNKSHKTAIWKPEWIELQGKTVEQEISEEYSEETFHQMMETVVEDFLLPLLQQGSGYVKDILENKNLPSHTQAREKILNTLAQNLLSFLECKK